MIGRPNGARPRCRRSPPTTAQGSVWGESANYRVPGSKSKTHSHSSPCIKNHGFFLKTHKLSIIRRRSQQTLTPFYRLNNDLHIGHLHTGPCWTHMESWERKCILLPQFAVREHILRLASTWHHVSYFRDGNYINEHWCITFIYIAVCLCYVDYDQLGESEEEVNPSVPTECRWTPTTARHAELSPPFQRCVS